MTTQIFAIRCKATGEFLSFGSKCAWLKTGFAKNAYNLHYAKTYSYSNAKPKFDGQDEYEIINLTEAFYRLEGLEK